MSDHYGGDMIRRVAQAVPADPEEFPDGVVDDVSIGLLVLAADGRLDVRRVLPQTPVCESTIVGHSQELRAAGLVRQVDPGQYVATEKGASVLAEANDTSS